MKKDKKAVTIFLSFMLFTCFAYGQWTKINDGSDLSFCSIAFPTAQVGYGIVESNIMKTLDGGISWTVVDSGNTSNLTCKLHFINADTGIAIMKQSLLIKTTNDGGQSWKTLVDMDSNIVNFKTAYFKAKFGWLIYSVNEGQNTTKDYLVKTDDAGNSWKHKTPYPYEGKLFFSDSLHGFSIDNQFRFNRSAKTSDGGRTWVNLPIEYTATGSDFYFMDSLNGFASGYYNGLLVKTNDAGNSWHELNIIDSTAMPDIVGLGILDSTIYSFGPSFSYVYKSTDLGQTWLIQKTSINTGFVASMQNEIEIVSTDTLFVKAGDGSIFKTTNGGIVGLKENNSLKKKIKLYPNPAKQNLRIEKLSDIEIKKIHLNDLSGKVVRQFEVKQRVLDVSGLLRTCYLLHILTEEGTIVSKVVLE